MARSRNLKPGFFKNEALAELPPLTRLLFSGLWCIADREGRLEDRPKRIRAELLPYDDGSVDAMLDELHQAGFILRYQHGEQRFIQVVNFTKHQNPHVREPESTIPAPGEHSTSTRQAPVKHRTGPADSLNPITDSLNPITSKNLLSSANTDDQAKTKRLSKKSKPDCPHQAIIDLYHELLPASPIIKDWTPARSALLRARWNEDPARQNLEYWKRLFEYVAESDFLTGRVSSPGRKPFCAPLEWLLKADNFSKVREARYHSEPTQ
jgi:hypothetical protein